jgi:hypothetical protein
MISLFCSAQHKVEFHPFILEFQGIDVLSKVQACDGCNIPFTKHVSTIILERPEFNNFQFGPQLKINSDSNSRFGYDIHLPIRKNSFNEYVLLDENNNRIDYFENKHVFWSFTPTLDIKLKLGNYKKGNAITIVAGASYDLIFDYYRTYGYYSKNYPEYEYFNYPKIVDESNDNASSGGMNLRFGIGYDFYKKMGELRDKKRLFSLKAVYQHTMYNPFNTKYSYKGKKIYEGWETKFGMIAVTLSTRIFRS